MENNKERIIDIDIKQEMQKSYIDYAMSVIVSRALPDVRDGLKPVHRRILYAMNELGFTPDKAYRKCARIVGDVLGKYHPHGDTSVYNALVRMAQEFSINELLIDGHGNFGSIDGDSAAAMRYTEAKMTKLSTELLRDIEKKTVDMTTNFDDTLKEPEVLPARFPNLLVNGSNGIAVGMATSIPPHNLAEIIDGTIKLIDDKEADVEDLIEIVHGPDFPTGAEVMGMEGFKRAYRTGRGKVLVRSKAEIEEVRKGKTAIVVTEIPYQVNKAKLLEGIADLVKNKKIEGITDLRDESNREGIRVVIELRRDVNPNIVLNKLYKHTQLQTTYSIIMIALVNGQPKVLNLYEVLSHYLNHQKDVETRRVQYDLKKAEDRAHILEGYKIAIENIDEVIKIIRAAYNDAEEKLMERFGLSEIQAKAIVDMRLRRLQGLEIEKIDTEYNELQVKIAGFKAILADEALLLDIIKTDLLALKDKYGSERKTSIGFNADEIDMEDLIEEEEVVITLTHQGYIKRVSASEYSIQKRGGKGKTGLSTKEEDFIEDIYITSTHDYLLFFTNFGKVYRKKAYFIPEGSRVSKGTAIINMLQLENGESVKAVVPVKTFEDGFLTMATVNGVIKKTALQQFDTSRKTGLIAINLNEGDELISVRHSSGENEIMLVTKNGKAIRFEENDVRPMGRTATGVRGIKLEGDDGVVTMEIVDADSKILVVSENGYGKRTSLVEYKVQARGGKGILTYNITEKTGNVIGAQMVKDGENLMIINSNGVMIRIKIDGISISGRKTSGVKLMRTGDDIQLVAIAKVAESDEDDENNEEVEVSEAPETTEA
jgi:DNA gyrase subunit A